MEQRRKNALAAVLALKDRFDKALSMVKMEKLRNDEVLSACPASFGSSILKTMRSDVHL